MDFKQGDIVYHKAEPAIKMVISAVNNLVSPAEFTCCYYNLVAGHFENATFYKEELISEDKKEE